MCEHEFQEMILHMLFNLAFFMFGAICGGYCVWKVVKKTLLDIAKAVDAIVDILGKMSGKT